MLNRSENNFRDLILMTLWIKANLKVGDQVKLEIYRKNKTFRRAIFRGLGSMPLETFKYLKITQLSQNSQRGWRKKYRQIRFIRYLSKVKTVLTFLNNKILKISLKKTIFLIQKCLNKLKKKDKVMKVKQIKKAKTNNLVKNHLDSLIFKTLIILRNLH